jgi:hypothetical protein
MTNSRDMGLYCNGSWMMPKVVSGRISKMVRSKMRISQNGDVRDDDSRGNDVRIMMSETIIAEMAMSKMMMSGMMMSDITI